MKHNEAQFKVSQETGFSLVPIHLLITYLFLVKTYYESSTISDMYLAVERMDILLKQRGADLFSPRDNGLEQKIARGGEIK